MGKTMRRLPPLHSLRAFEAAARHLSFKDAAEELAVSPTAISHHVRQLEAVLGVQLFERHARRVELTAHGKQLYPVLRDGFEAFAHAIDHLRTQRLRRVVTLSATVAFTGRWLLPRVGAFHRRHRHLDLRLHASDDPVDLQKGVADAAIRYGNGRYPGLSHEVLASDTFAPVCSAALRLRRPHDLADHTFIHFEWRHPRRNDPVWARWLKHVGIERLKPRSQVYFTDESQAITAAIAGHGVALASLLLVADELARGTLVQPFGPTLPGYIYSLVYREDSAQSEHIVALRDWIRTEFDGCPFGLMGNTAFRTHR